MSNIMNVKPIVIDLNNPDNSNSVYNKKKKPKKSNKSCSCNSSQYPYGFPYPYPYYPTEYTQYNQQQPIPSQQYQQHNNIQRISSQPTDIFSTLESQIGGDNYGNYGNIESQIGGNSYGNQHVNIIKIHKKRDEYNNRGCKKEVKYTLMN